MSYANYPLLFSLQGPTEVDPKAHMFLVPDGPRTHEYLDGYNKKCEEWMAEITKDDPHPEGVTMQTNGVITLAALWCSAQIPTRLCP